MQEKTIQKLDPGKLTNKVSKYPGWREIVENEILGCGLKNRVVQQFIDDMNHTQIEEIQERELPEELK